MWGLIFLQNDANFIITVDVLEDSLDSLIIPIGYALIVGGEVNFLKGCTLTITNQKFNVSIWQYNSGFYYNQMNFIDFFVSFEHVKLHLNNQVIHNNL
jgi:hypothetical protein